MINEVKNIKENYIKIHKLEIFNYMLIILSKQNSNMENKLFEKISIKIFNIENQKKISLFNCLYSY